MSAPGSSSGVHTDGQPSRRQRPRGLCWALSRGPTGVTQGLRQQGTRMRLAVCDFKWDCASPPRDSEFCFTSCRLPDA